MKIKILSSVKRKREITKAVNYYKEFNLEMDYQTFNEKDFANQKELHTFASTFKKDFDVVAIVRTPVNTQAVNGRVITGDYNLGIIMVFDFNWYFHPKTLKFSTRKTILTQVENTLIHEIGHFLSEKLGVKDLLHDYIDMGQFYLYKDYLLRNFKKKVLDKNLLYKVLDAIMRKKRNLPLVERQAQKFIKLAGTHGYDLRITSAYRTNEEQTKLYAQGRENNLPIITNAKAGESLHNYGVSIDIVDRKSGYDIDWNHVGKLGKSLGFSWGGDWKNFVDKPHFEMTLGYSLKDFQTGKVDYSKFN